MTNTPDPQNDRTAAADLIRDKLARIYANEPDAATEAREAEAVQHRSKHQRFMHELSTSGKDLATIQTEWHNYYQSLGDEERHQVWQEFYSSSATLAQPQPVAEAAPDAQAMANLKHEMLTTPRHKAQRAQKAARPKRDVRSPQAIRAAVRDKVSANGKLTAKHHVQSLLFGLGMGAVVVFIFLFGLFSEGVIRPFVQPNNSTNGSTPIILASATTDVPKDPQVIIPKINVQIPVDYTQTTTTEESIQASLENGVTHYPSTVKPGEQGNTAIFGHSSNNIFNKGKFKFAFLLLNKMEVGDTFYLSYEGKMYVYKVIDKKVVAPTEVSILDPIPGKAATATLITCDPPGTTLKRLAVIGEQITPDPTGNVAATPPPVAPAGVASALPGNGPTLLGKLVRSGIGKTLLIIVIIAAIIAVVRWTSRQRA